MVILDGLYIAMPDLIFLAPQTTVLLPTSVGSGLQITAKTQFLLLHGSS